MFDSHSCVTVTLTLKLKASDVLWSYFPFVLLCCPFVQLLGQQLARDVFSWKKATRETTEIQTSLWSGTIIRDRDRKSWDPRAPMIWDNFSIAPSLGHRSALIHTRVVGSCVDVIRLCDQMVRVSRFSCQFFTAMAGNKAEKKNQGFSIYFYAWVNGMGVFIRSIISLISRCEWIISPSASCTHKLLCLFCREELCNKTFYCGIELSCEFPKQCFIITKTCFC